MRISNISKTYSGRVILDDISAEFNVGLNFIIGDSGEGKSTLLNILGALDGPDSGTISVDNLEVTARDDECEAYRSDIIGFIFQEANLINGLTVFENIKIASSMSPQAVSDDEINGLLKQFNMDAFKDSVVDTLSGGEKQRVALVRALAKNAKIILADEPTGSLDSENTEIVFKHLKDISEEHVVIVITHNKELAFEYGDAVFELKKGKLTPIKPSGEGPARDAGRTQLNASESVISNQYIRKLTFNNISRHKGKFISMAIALAVVSMLLGCVYLLKSAVKSNTDTLNTTYYNIDEVDIYPVDYSDWDDPASTMAAESGGYFTQEEIEQIESTDMFAAIVPYASDTYHLDTYEEIDIKPILLNEFFSDRIMTDDIEGDFPSSDNEIIIGEDLAQELYEGDAIGESLIIYDSYGNEFELEIVGINHQSNVDGIYYNYVSTDLFQENIRQEYSYATFIYIKEHIENRGTTLSEDSSGCMVKSLSDGSVIFGEDNPDDGQMVISVEIFKELYYSLTGNEADDVTSENITEFIETDEDAAQIFETEYYIDGNYYYEVTIVGIHDGDEYDILVSEDFYAETNAIRPNVLQCYAEDYNILYSLMFDTDIEGFSFYSYYAERFEVVGNNSLMMNTLFIILLIVAAIIFILVINSFVKVSLADKTQEVGILKSLGARKKDLKKLLVYESGLLGISAGIAGAVLYIIFVIVLPFVAELKISSWLVFAVVLIILAIGPGIISTLLSLPKTGKVLKEKPADTLRKK